MWVIIMQSNLFSFKWQIGDQPAQTALLEAKTTSTVLVVPLERITYEHPAGKAEKYF